MTPRIAVLLAFGVVSLFGQAQTTPSRDGQPQPTADQQAKPAGDAQRSAIDVKPGSLAIKNKDIWNETGFFHPFVRMPKYVLRDQKAIWTSPFHTAKSDVKYWAIFGAAASALIASDKWTVKQLPNSSAQISVSNWASRVGSAYSLIPISTAFYVIGTAKHEERFRETGLLAFETLIDVNVVAEGLKLAAGRARPFQNDGNGHFEDSPSRWSSGFPSGHAINTWALASIVAHEYPHPRIIPVLAYGLASVVVCARVGARQHFPGDVVAGSAMGWFIGDYVYGKRHNSELDHKKTFAEKFFDHVNVGASLTQ